MALFVGLDVSQKLTSICVVDDTGRRVWRGQCASDPEQIARLISRHAGDAAGVGIETGPMTPWLVHEFRARGLNVTCLDARHASAALKMQMNKTDQNDAEGLAQIMRTGWYRSVHVKSLDAHRARALLGARAQLVGMTTRLSNHIRGVLKTFGLLPGAIRGLPFDRRVETLLADRRQANNMGRTIEAKSPRRRLMSVPGIGVVFVLAYVSTLREQIAAFDKEVRGLAKKDPISHASGDQPGAGADPVGRRGGGTPWAAAGGAGALPRLGVVSDAGEQPAPSSVIPSAAPIAHRTARRPRQRVPRSRASAGRPGRWSGPSRSIPCAPAPTI